MESSLAEMDDIIHRLDIKYVFDCVVAARCCAIVGLSNVGKSYLLRTLSSPPVYRHFLAETAERFLFVYIDFNLMLNLSDQGFYELILRSILTKLETLPLSNDLVAQVHQSYQGIVKPLNLFNASLSFVEGITAICDHLGRYLVLLCDEFDEPFYDLDDRVFLNLRALKDRYPQNISYVTATGQRLRDMRKEHGAAEFSELFAHDVHFLRPLERADATTFVEKIIARSDTQLTSEQKEFLWEQTGGHLGLLESSSQALLAAQRDELEGEPIRQLTRRMQQILDDNLNVRTECAKLWNSLSGMEQQVLMQFLAGEFAETHDTTWRSLCEKGILVRQNDTHWHVFGVLFRDFAHRQALVKLKSARGIRMDVDAGTVWVDGNSIPELTSLEYRLLLLLYGNLNKICDKYRIVEAVWSEEFLDEVDDARVEKLMSRLRQKIEPDPTQPHYLLTVRGRGYKLIGPPS